jgi:hypothetical protein
VGEAAASGPRVPLGCVLIARGAIAAFLAAMAPLAYLERHAHGDWGDVDEEDRQENELSLERGFRIVSVYRLGTDEKIYIITEADRSATTILLASEY